MGVLGNILLKVVEGDTKSYTFTPEEASQWQFEISSALQPKLDKIRQDHIRAAQHASNIVLD